MYGWVFWQEEENERLVCVFNKLICTKIQSQQLCGVVLWVSRRCIFLSHGSAIISHFSCGQERLSYPCGFDLVPGIAHPAWVVRERLAFLPLQARLHLTPPLPNYYGCYRQQRQEKRQCRYLLPEKSAEPDRTAWQSAITCCSNYQMCHVKDVTK